MPVHIMGLSSPDSPTCHSSGVIKACSFCLKVGDERRTAVRDLVGLTDQIRIADHGEESYKGGERRLRMFLPKWIRGGGEGKVYVEEGSVSVIIRGKKRGKLLCLFILEKQILVAFLVALSLELKDSGLRQRW